eukprot:TRINITY_DN12604_c0_g1_i19.p1 TRINITY_DN12604_c0_g1~~TRINITY_DN12604_c0_g1_i19.p1  ORF type:complete len:197 (-),score=46.09 TRINITY_DN12604_c0_g1_i19:45-635(-)
MDKEKVNKYKAMLREMYKERMDMDRLFKECKELYASEGREEKIRLPEPRNSSVYEVMTSEEKSLFWESAFLSKETKLENLYFQLLNSASSSEKLSSHAKANSMAPATLRLELPLPLFGLNNHSTATLLPPLKSKDNKFFNANSNESTKSSLAVTSVEAVSPRPQRLPSLPSAGMIRSAQVEGYEAAGGTIIQGGSQ